MVEFEMTQEAGGGKGQMAMASCSSSFSAAAAAANQSLITLPPQNGVSQYVPYPPPLARLEDVMISPMLFMDTLEKLHASMGTKFMVPTVGGRELEMHRLFVEVTSRGGIEKVIRDRRWREVTSLFQYPPTATNASHMVRKHYGQYLFHYEQIYYFKAKGWTPSSGLSALPAAPRDYAEPLQSSQAAQRINFEGFSTGVPPTATRVTGVIDGKFEFGYSISVTIGSKKLKGVLYQTPQSTGQIVTHSQTVPAVANSSNPGPSGVQRRRRRKKSEMKKRDPARPKPNRSGYNFFFAEQHSRLKPQYLGKDREISRMIGELWSNMNESGRGVYKQKAVADKERYKSELEAYKEKLQTGPMTSNAVPTQQLPIIELDVNTAETSQRMETTQEEGEESPDTAENEISTDKSGKSVSEDMDVDGSGGLEQRVDKVGDESLESSGNAVVVETENHDSVLEEGRETMDSQGIQQSLPTEQKD